ncbi:nucleotidyltransferase family protein (plasmid) [Streptomyces sp. JL4002]|uniref:Nucleotidyltransferase family protein n=1 Tax=Streptomyces liliifuscus TaxID=2797636 RepID=A0A7T7RI56_9ACTN|nr:nucleotidyltransferase family protein [Streptomyces liliifuscus]QQM47506.1 nucleotidyltransferase family protein [Streptomyces liliifuscus]
MNAPARPTAATPPLPAGDGPAAAALRWLCDPHPDIRPSAPASVPLGTVLEAAIDAKLVCLLAHRLLSGPPDASLSRPMRSVLGQIARANTLHNQLHRNEAVRIVRALTGRGVPVAVLNGLAYDTALYPPGGLRQFTDIDLLVDAADRDAALDVLAELGFTQPGRGAHTRRRSTGDALTPTVSIDITTGLGHTADPADVRAALARTEAAGDGDGDGGEALPVLAQADALAHALARLAARPRWSGLADAARLALAAPDSSHEAAAAVPEPLRAGWAVLHSRLPDLVPGPPPVACGPGREEVAR